MKNPTVHIRIQARQSRKEKNTIKTELNVDHNSIFGKQHRNSCFFALLYHCFDGTFDVTHKRFTWNLGQAKP